MPNVPFKKRVPHPVLLPEAIVYEHAAGLEGRYELLKLRLEHGLRSFVLRQRLPNITPRLLVPLVPAGYVKSVL
jgi:hypothetical protein